jgi:hypothetical protein
MATARDRHYDTTGGACIGVAGLAPAMQQQDAHPLFPIYCCIDSIHIGYSSEYPLQSPWFRCILKRKKLLTS